MKQKEKYNPIPHFINQPRIDAKIKTELERKKRQNEHLVQEVMRLEEAADNYGYYLRGMPKHAFAARYVEIREIGCQIIQWRLRTGTTN